MKCIYPYDDCDRPVPMNNLYCEFHRPSNLPTPGIHSSGYIAIEAVRFTSGVDYSIDLDFKLAEVNIVTAERVAGLKTVITEDPIYGLARIEYVIDRSALEPIKINSTVRQIADIIFRKSRPG